MVLQSDLKKTASKNQVLNFVFSSLFFVNHLHSSEHMSVSFLSFLSEICQ